MGVTVLGYFVIIFAYVFPTYKEDTGALLDITVGFGGLIIVEAVSFFAAQSLENKRHLETNRRQHADDLIKEILSRLAKITLGRDVDDKLYVELPKKEKNDDEEDDYDFGESDYEPIDKLPQPYYRMTLRHLEKYEQITDSQDATKKFAEKHNELLDKAKELVKNLIRETFNQNFPNIKESGRDSEYGYYLGRLTEDMSHYLYIKSENLPSLDPEDEKEDRKFSLREISEEPHTTNYMIGRYRDPFVVCSKKQEISFNRLNELLNTICTDEKIVEQFDEIVLIAKKCDNAHTSFHDEINLLIASLRSGVQLKGKCELGY